MQCNTILLFKIASDINIMIMDTLQFHFVFLPFDIPILFDNKNTRVPNYLV